jgi:hypothetical protein
VEDNEAFGSTVPIPDTEISAISLQKITTCLQNKRCVVEVIWGGEASQQEMYYYQNEWIHLIQILELIDNRQHGGAYFLINKGGEEKSGVGDRIPE